jgi:hypothetical protein
MRMAAALIVSAALFACGGTPSGDAPTAHSGSSSNDNTRQKQTPTTRDSTTHAPGATKPQGSGGRSKNGN